MKLLLKDADKVRVIADSAIARNRQPWFLPAEGKNWRWRQAVGYRVSKLGKRVSPKFIDRYIDAVTTLWVAETDDFNHLDFMDGAVVCGDWIEISEPLPAAELARFTDSTTIKNGDILAFMLSVPAQPIEINRHISIARNGTEVLCFNIK